MRGDYSRGHEPDRKRGRSYRRVLLQQGRPLLDSDVAATVDALLGEVRATTRGLSCDAGSPDLGLLVTPGRLVAVFAEAADGVQVTGGTPDVWIDYRYRYADRYPALYIAAEGGAQATVTMPVIQALDPAVSTSAALWARVDAPATIAVNGVPVALAPDSPDVPQRVEFDAAGDRLDPLEIAVPAGEAVWLFMLEQVEEAGDRPTFWVAPGTYHVDGLVLDGRGGGAFPGVAFPQSAGFPWETSPVVDPPLDGLVAPPGLGAGDLLVAYVEAHERHITHVEDPGIREQALGAYDTTARTELLGQVKLATVAAGLDVDDIRGAFDVVEESLGELTVEASQATPATSPCDLPDVAGYSGADNRLYRFEIHRGGGLGQVQIKWSRDNGSELFAAELDNGNLLFDAGTPLAADDLVEVLSHVVDLGDDELANVAADWFVPPDRAVGQLARLDALDVESSSDEVVFRLVDRDDPGTVIQLDERYGLDDERVLKVRRWHGLIEPAQLAADPIGQSGPHDVEDGITLQVSGIGTFRPGQFWQYEARVGSANANGPWRVTPHGPERRFAPLALLEYEGPAQPLRLVTWLDDRFSHPCELEADDVEFAGARVGSASDTVQEALEELFEKPPVIVDSSCGEIVVRPENDLQAVFDSIPERANARLCIHPGTWTVGETVTVARKGNLVISGAGMVATRLVGSDLDTVLQFDDCASVRMEDLSVEGGLLGAVGDGLAGSLSINHSLLVDLTRVLISCDHATSRRMSAVMVRGMGCFVLTSVRIRDCIVSTGHAQVGLLVIDARTVDIEGNEVLTPEIPVSLADAVLDPEVGGRVGKRILDEVTFGETDEFPEDFLLGGDNVSEREAVDNRTRVLVFLEEWGNQFIAFTTTTPLGSDGWRQALVSNPLPGNWRDGRRPPDEWIGAGLRRLRAQLAAAMFERDDLTLPSATRSALVDAGRDIASEDNETATGDQGIVVAGRGTLLGAAGVVLDDPNPHPDARVTGNRVRGFVQGIHIGTSRARPGLGPGQTRLAYRATIADNTVQLRVPSLARARHGIFVGNAFHAKVDGNTVHLTRPESGPHTSLDAIRAIGWFGPLIQIEENSCFGTRNGVVAHAINPNDATAPGSAWMVSNNAHTNHGGGGVAEQTNWQYWRRIGAPGQPGFQNNWSNYDPNRDRAAGFYRDPWGFVHLQGVVRGGTSGAPMFTLPPGYRPDTRGPDRNAHFPVVATGQFGFVLITADGTVRLAVGPTGYVDLGSIHFRGA